MVKAHTPGFHAHFGIQFQQQLCQGFDLGAAHMPGPVLLAVEIGGVHHVIIHQHQIAHAAAGQHQGCV